MARRTKRLTAMSKHVDLLPESWQAAIRACVAQAPPLTPTQAAVLRRVFAPEPTTPNVRRKATATKGTAA